MTDFSKIMQQAQQVQKNIQETQKKIAQLTLTISSVGDLATVTVNGKHRVKITIDPALIKEGAETTADVVSATVNQAIEAMEEASQEEMMGLMSGMDLPKDMLEQFGGGEKGGER